MTLFPKKEINAPLNDPNQIENLSVQNSLAKMPIITDQLAGYIFNNCFSPSKELANIREMSKQESWGFMTTSPDQAAFLALLIKISGAKNALEVGCYLGHSTISIASALPQDGHVFSLDSSREWAEIAFSKFARSKLENKITLILGNATESIKELHSNFIMNQKEFDFVFIDADKINSLNYYKEIISMVRSGGLILIDNVLWRGKIADESISSERSEALRKLNQFVLNDDRVESVILTISDGMTLIRKK